MDDEDRYTRITLRIPKELHQSLAMAAERTSKSLNAEIIGRLQASTIEELDGHSRIRAIGDELLEALVTLSLLRSERAVYQLRMDLSQATGQQLTGLEEMAQRLTAITAEIARCELIVERFRSAAMQDDGQTGPSKPARKESQRRKPNT